MLIVLGVRAWRAAWLSRRATGAAVAVPVVPETAVGEGEPALAALQVVLETGLYLSLAASVASAGGWFRRPAIRRRLEAVSGTVLVGLGVRVAAVSH